MSNQTSQLLTAVIEFKKIKTDKVLFYGGNAIVLLMMYGLLILLLKFLAPQVAAFIVQVSPMIHLSESEQYEHAYNYAIALETCIFLLTAVGQDKAAKWFMAVSITTQLLFMHRWDGILLSSVWNDPLAASEGIRLLLGSVVISFMSPIAMWYLSEQIKERLDLLRSTAEERKMKRQQRQLIAAELELKRAKVKNWFGWMGKLANSKKVGSELAEPILAEKLTPEPKIFKYPHHVEGNGFTCGICNATFETIAGLNGHQRVHREFDKKAAEERELITY